MVPGGQTFGRHWPGTPWLPALHVQFGYVPVESDGHLPGGGGGGGGVALPEQARPFHVWPSGQQPPSGICRLVGHAWISCFRSVWQRLAGTAAAAKATSSAAIVFDGKPSGKKIAAPFLTMH